MLRKLLLRKSLPAALAFLFILVGCGTKSANLASTDNTITSPNIQGKSPATTVGATPPATIFSSTGASIGVSSSDRNNYAPSWVTPVLNGEQVSISLSAITKGKIVHFWVTMPIGSEAFMAYTMDSITYMRAAICVPCESIGFSLQKGSLVCDTCGTEFDAKTGKGVSGGCINYPKSEVKYELAGGYVVTTIASLQSAYDETVLPGG